jgi:hypothetical protein
MLIKVLDSPKGNSQLVENDIEEIIELQNRV